MQNESVTVQINSGLETRPIAMMVQIASRFQSNIQLTSGAKRVNAKSIMGMMSLGLDSGEQVEITADGPDEAEALQSLKAYLTKDKAQ